MAFQNFPPVGKPTSGAAYHFRSNETVVGSAPMVVSGLGSNSGNAVGQWIGNAWDKRLQKNAWVTRYNLLNATGRVLWTPSRTWADYIHRNVNNSGVGTPTNIRVTAYLVNDAYSTPTDPFEYPAPTFGTSDFLLPIGAEHSTSHTVVAKSDMVFESYLASNGVLSIREVHAIKVKIGNLSVRAKVTSHNAAIPHADNERIVTPNYVNSKSFTYGGIRYIALVFGGVGAETEGIGTQVVVPAGGDWFAGLGASIHHRRRR